MALVPVVLLVIGSYPVIQNLALQIAIILILTTIVNIYSHWTYLCIPIQDLCMLQAQANIHCFRHKHQCGKLRQRMSLWSARTKIYSPHHTLSCVK